MPFTQLSEAAVKEPMPGYVGKFVHSERMTFVHWNIRADAPLPEHSHPHEQVVNVWEGRFELNIAGQTQILEPGCVAIIPPDALHSGRALTACRILDVFCPVREDYR